MIFYLRAHLMNIYHSDVRFWTCKMTGVFMLPYKYLNVTPYRSSSSIILSYVILYLMFTASRIFILKLIFFFLNINPLYFLETLRTCLSSGALDPIALIYNRHDSPCNVCYGKTSSRSVVKDVTVRKSGRAGGNVSWRQTLFQFEESCYKLFTCTTGT